MKRFTVEKHHLELLRLSWIRFDPGPEWGSARVDGKRPYGNSDMHHDIAEVLGIPRPDDWEEYTTKEIDLIEKTHKDMTTVLQILCCNLTISAGDYVAPSHSLSWVRVPKGGDHD